MTEQVLDLRKSLLIVWRQKAIVGIIAGLGLFAGAFAGEHSSCGVPDHSICRDTGSCGRQ
jgi:hypothetical protein